MKQEKFEKIIEKEEIEGSFRLPKGWIWRRLGEIGEVVTGTTPSKSREEYYARDFPFYKPTDLNNGYYVRKSEDGLSKKGIEEARLLPVKSILVTCIGATIGKTGFIRIEGASNQQINAIIPEKHILPEFVYFMCITPQFQKSIIDNASATTLPILNKSKFKDLDFPLPPLPEQKRIVSKIEELFTDLDAGVEALKKIKAQLKRYRQAVLKYAFEGKLTEEWRKGNKDKIEPASVLLERIKEGRRKNTKGRYKELYPVDSSDLTKLPEGWAWTKLGEIISVKSGEGLTSYRMVTDGKYPVYGGNGITGYHDKFMFEESKLIIGRVGAKCGVVHITQPKSWITDNALIADFPYMDIKFLFYAIGHLNLNKYSESTAQPVISGSKIYPILFSMPPLQEQYKIVEEIERRFSVADEVEKIIDNSLKQAQRLRQSILKRAFEGRLVPQDPADEPAERLLERIKAEKAKQQEKNRLPPVRYKVKTTRGRG